MVFLLLPSHDSFGLDSAYEEKHMVLVFLSWAYFVLMVLIPSIFLQMTGVSFLLMAQYYIVYICCILKSIII